MVADMHPRNLPRPLVVTDLIRRGDATRLVGFMLVSVDQMTLLRAQCSVNSALV